MDKQQRLESVREVLNELSRTVVLATICIERLQELVAADEPRDYRCRGGPHIDADRLSVVWKQRCCLLGNTTSFRLMSRLLRRVNRYVSYERLREDVWYGETRSADTVRSAVRQLKLKLRAAGMRDLASAIKGQGQHYGLILGRK